jgi:hypothetical protein
MNAKSELIEKNWLLKSQEKQGTIEVKKGLFTNVCKKV